jgi:hypothetical protein
MWTDGEWNMEVGTGGVGGMVIAGHLDRPLATGGQVPPPMCKELLYGDKIQRNTQTEPLGVFLTLMMFAHHLRGCDIIVFVDNEATIANLLAGSSGETDSNDIVCRIWTLARDFNIAPPWVYMSLPLPKWSLKASHCSPPSTPPFPQVP